MHVAAIDGGGTKTAGAMADRRGAVTILPPLPGSSPQDGPGWEAVWSEALSRVARGAEAVVLGVAGRDEVPAHDRAVDALVASRLACPWEAINDVALAHLGAFGGGPGVLILSGTGSMAWARGPAGEARVGGWGDVIGDEGSAHWIGREALARAAQALDGRGPGDLPFAQALCGRLGATGPFAPLAWLMERQAGRAAVAGVARHVDALGLAGHGAAQEIMAGAAGHLARAARVAAGRVGLAAPLPWVARGGTFASAVLVALVTHEIGGWPPATPRLTTLGGGLLRAARLAGWDADDAWAAKVDARLRAFA